MTDPSSAAATPPSPVLPDAPVRLPAPPDDAGRALLLWDGDCGLCRRAAAWVQYHDRAGRLLLIPFQEAPSPPLTPALRTACQSAIHLITPEGEILRAGRAAMRVLELLGWRILPWLTGIPPFSWLTELGYGLVARNRNFFSRLIFRRPDPTRPPEASPSCSLTPPPTQTRDDAPPGGGASEPASGGILPPQA